MAAPELPRHDFYPTRSGERVIEQLAELLEEPERPLEPEARNRVVAFEHDLTVGEYVKRSGDRMHVSDERTLESVTREAKYLATRHEVTGDYFLSQDGRDHAHLYGIEIDEHTTSREVIDQLRIIMTRNTEGNASERTAMIKDLESASNEWAIAEITKEILGEQGKSPDFTRAMIFDGAEKLTNAVRSFAAYRNFYLRVRGDLAHERDGEYEIAAKRAIVEVELKVLNGRLAELYPDILWAWDQANAAGDTALKETLREVWPAGEAIATARPEVRVHFIHALDRLRNGMSENDDGTATAINPELRQLFAERVHEVSEAIGGRFTPEEYERLSNITFDAEGMQAFCKDILADLGLLSTEPEDSYYPDRPHRAADGKWQVVVRPEVSAMGAEDPEGILEIPAKFKRNLTKVTAPVGVIAGAAHEITHIYQLNNIKANPATLALAKQIRGRSSLVLREAGSVYSEHLVQQELFGVSRPDSPHYMRAMEVIEAGGGEKKAIEAFYASYMEANPTESPAAAVEVAESRVKRLCRRYGGYNSQPLNYAQTSAFVAAADTMTNHQRDVAFAEGAFDLPDMKTLHRFGLLGGEVMPFPIKEFCDIVERRLRKMLE